MPDFTFNLSPQIDFGNNTLGQVGAKASEWGQRVILVTESILYENGVIEQVQSSLESKGMTALVYDEVVPHATTLCMENALKLARASRSQVVIGMGGINALSIAKGVAMAVQSSCEVDDFLSQRGKMGLPTPLIEIPSTGRNPFLFQNRFLAVDARNRRSILVESQKNLTRQVIFDPQLCLSLPVKYCFTLMLETLLHCIEGYLSLKNNYMSELYFSQAMMLLSRAFPDIKHEPNGPEKRVLVPQTGLLSAMGLASSSFGLASALALAIHGLFLVPKSWVAAILLPHILEFHMETSLEKIAQCAVFLGEAHEDDDTIQKAEKTIHFVRRWIGEIDIPARLKDFDIPLDRLNEVCDIVYYFSDLGTLPRSVSVPEIYEICKAAY
ncbi:MAG: iron-containing alcohol dehydrogenase [Spirochaetales bacterium]|nr:iron-containing alcohol dehydrogenase [Spirochaetales bacterium]